MSKDATTSGDSSKKDGKGGGGGGGGKGSGIDNLKNTFKNSITGKFDFTPPWDRASASNTARLFNNIMKTDEDWKGLTVNKFKDLFAELINAPNNVTVKAKNNAAVNAEEFAEAAIIRRHFTTTC